MIELILIRLIIVMFHDENLPYDFPILGLYDDLHWMMAELRKLFDDYWNEA